MKMNVKLSDLSLRTRLILVFIVILLSLAAINCVQIYLFVGYVKQYNAMMETITLTNTINGELKQQLDNEIRDIAYGRVPFGEGNQYEFLANMRENLNQIEKDDKKGRFVQEISAVRENLSSANDYIDKLGEQIQRNAPADEKNTTYEYITIITDLIDNQVQTLLQSTLNASELSQKSIVTSLKRDITIYIASFIGVIILSFLFAWYISGSFVKPIRALGKKTNEIAEGNLTIGAIAIPSKNEIGDLCRSYNRMFYNLKDIIVNVRNTNDLVVLTSKDIHQSILENRLAGEEVAEATQTISINLHKQDELIRKSASTFDLVFQTFNEILLKTNKIYSHSSEALQTNEEIQQQIKSFEQKFINYDKKLQQINVDLEYIYRSTNHFNEMYRLIRLIAKEPNLLSRQLHNDEEEIKNKTEINRASELFNELYKRSHLTEKETLQTHQRISSIKDQISFYLNDIHESINITEQLKSTFLKKHTITRNEEIEYQRISSHMQEAFKQMESVRQIISEIEYSSKLSKSEVIAIAAMGEEQLTTLEEVSDASYKLVERIQKMKDNIRQFTI
ncbi:methyl-accepting chemotaxis protein [Metabacillus litoralis]|uniref:Methyl-accepting chemotaxis protein n=2 Tax=Metabacillus litoralis TaxID=152268 RepID=A0A5C6W669_9BACI|nr:methyl-accepting chemotaxis protein [Metabacillus litoralis]